MSEDVTPFIDASDNARTRKQDVVKPPTGVVGSCHWVIGEMTSVSLSLPAIRLLAGKPTLPHADRGIRKMK